MLGESGSAFWKWESRQMAVRTGWMVVVGEVLMEAGVLVGTEGY